MGGTGIDISSSTGILEVVSGVCSIVTAYPAYDGSAITNIPSCAFTPTTSADWASVPTTIQAALDDLAATTSSGSVGGSDTQVLYNSAGVETGDANLTWNHTNQTFAVVGALSNAALSVTNNGYVATFCFNVSTPGSDYAASFSDGVRTVNICDGINNITYGDGAGGAWDGTAPTDVWVALDRLATLIKTLNGGTGA